MLREGVHCTESQSSYLENKTYSCRVLVVPGESKSFIIASSIAEKSRPPLHSRVRFCNIIISCCSLQCTGAISGTLSDLCS